MNKYTHIYILFTSDDPAGPLNLYKNMYIYIYMCTRPCGHILGSTVSNYHFRKRPGAQVMSIFGSAKRRDVGVIRYAQNWDGFVT